MVDKLDLAHQVCQRVLADRPGSFCGFESLYTAHTFVGVFDKVYRLTPFSDDKPSMRGKCPLELAGYDIRQLPLATLWNGLSIEWPMEAPREDVPNR